MSIVQDALKKAQSYLASQKPDQVEKKDPPVMPGPENKDTAVCVSAAPLKVPRNLILLVVVLVGASIYYLNTDMVKNRLKKKKADTALSAPPIAYQEVAYKPAASDKRPAAQQKPAVVCPTLSLNGIMYLDSGPRAVINGGIVEVGDMVSGAEIVSIDRKKVTLRFEDTEIILSLRN